jgi:hypothetical protein
LIPPSFLNRIPGWPAAGHRVVVAVTVIVESGFRIQRLGAEAVGEEVAGVGVDDGVSERVVFEVGGDSAVGGEVFAHVAVAVVGRIVDRGLWIVDVKSEQAADSAGSLEGAG